MSKAESDKEVIRELGYGLKLPRVYSLVEPKIYQQNEGVMKFIKNC